MHLVQSETCPFFPKTVIFFALLQRILDSGRLLPWLIIILSEYFILCSAVRTIRLTPSLRRKYLQKYLQLDSQPLKTMNWRPGCFNLSLSDGIRKRMAFLHCCSRKFPQHRSLLIYKVNNLEDRFKI